MEPACAVEAAFAQPLTMELLGCAGIRPGMRVLVLGRDLADLALLIAERVGRHGEVIGANADPSIVARARQRALDEGFDRVEFRAESLRELHLDGQVDAVVGRFFLMHEPVPVEAIRRVARTLRNGGLILFHEWHYESILWPQTSDWPHVPLYRRFAQLSIESMRRRKMHVDMGLRLVNVFTEAGLPLPDLRSDLRVVRGAASLGYDFFEEAMRELLPTIARHSLERTEDIDVNTFAQRLRRETIDAGGHLFLPLQMGAWTRVSTQES
jgi:SAM-dependent methyltransferase